MQRFSMYKTVENGTQYFLVNKHFVFQKPNCVISVFINLRSKYGFSVLTIPGCKNFALAFSLKYKLALVLPFLLLLPWHHVHELYFTCASESFSLVSCPIRDMVRHNEVHFMSLLIIWSQFLTYEAIKPLSALNGEINSRKCYLQ